MCHQSKNLGVLWSEILWMICTWRLEDWEISQQLTDQLNRQYQRQNNKTRQEENEMRPVDLMAVQSYEVQSPDYPCIITPDSRESNDVTDQRSAIIWALDKVATLRFQVQFANFLGIRAQREKSYCLLIRYTHSDQRSFPAPQ